VPEFTDAFSAVGGSFSLISSVEGDWPISSKQSLMIDALNITLATAIAPVLVKVQSSRVVVDELS
jgi:hypothetical protein